MLLLIESLIAGLLAYAAAATVLPINALVLVFWLSITIEAFRMRLRGKQRMHAFVGLACTLMVVSSVLIAAAHYKPTKTVEKALNRIVMLDSTEMSLAHLDYCAAYHRDRFPVRLSFTFADDDKNFIVKWPSRSPTLGQFIEHIETQSPLRHRFLHCGNGWTLLHGGDCSFGLSIRDPQLIGPPPRPKKVYESGSYNPPDTDSAT
jgi:hypothetical protein